MLILLNPYCSCILLHELIIIRSSNIIIYIILYQLVLIFKKEIVWLAISPLQTKRPPPRRFLMTNLFGPTWRQLRRSCWRSEVWGKWKPMRRKLKIHQVIGSLLPRTYSFCWQASWIYTIDMCIYIYEYNITCDLKFRPFPRITYFVLLQTFIACFRGFWSWICADESSISPLDDHPERDFYRITNEINEKKTWNVFFLLNKFHGNCEVFN